jgi:hypothetical protein
MALYLASLQHGLRQGVGVDASDTKLSSKTPIDSGAAELTKNIRARRRCADGGGPRRLGTLSTTKNGRPRYSIVLNCSKARGSSLRTYSPRPTP